jgi:hypothetical protein
MQRTAEATHFKSMKELLEEAERATEKDVVLQKYRAIFEYITQKERENVQRFVEQEAKFVDTVDRIKNLLEQRSSIIPDIPDQILVPEISPPSSPAPARQKGRRKNNGKRRGGDTTPPDAPKKRAPPSYTKKLWQAFGTPRPGIVLPTSIPFPISPAPPKRKAESPTSITEPLKNLRLMTDEECEKEMESWGFTLDPTRTVTEPEIIKNDISLTATLKDFKQEFSKSIQCNVTVKFLNEMGLEPVRDNPNAKGEMWLCVGCNQLLASAIIDLTTNELCCGLGHTNLIRM